MIDYDDIDETYNEEEPTPRVFKLITGEEIVTTVTRTDEHYFVVEVPLEIRYNSIKGSLFLSKWMVGADYSKVMTLAGASVVSVSAAEQLVVDNYYTYREEMVKSLSEFIVDEDDEDQEEYNEILLEEPDDDTPTYH